MLSFSYLYIYGAREAIIVCEIQPSNLVFVLVFILVWVIQLVWIELELAASQNKVQIIHILYFILMVKMINVHTTVMIFF